MKRLGLIIWLVLLPQMVWAAAYTSTQTGDWNNSSTWGGSGIPGNGDTVTIANGHTVTVPVGYTAVVGTSPANDTGAVALQCASASGTGVLVVNGTLIWKGPVRQANATWTVNAGATLTYDASGAATPASALYTWQIAQANSQANAKLVFDGSSGSRVTVNSVGNINSGGFGNTGTNYQGGGRIEAAYTDFSYMGAATTSGVFCSTQPDANSTFRLQDCTLTSCGMHWARNTNGAAILEVIRTKFSSPANPQFTLQWELANAKTTGSRKIESCVIYGQVLLTGTAGQSTGLSIKHNVLRKVSYTNTYQLLAVSNGASCDAWEQNLFFIATDSSSSDKVTLPASPSGGALLNTYVFRHGNPSPTLANPHPLYVQPYSLAYDIDGFVWEYDGTDDNGDFLQISRDATASVELNVHRNLFLPNGAGLAVGSYVNNSSGTAQTNLKIRFNHNTCAVSGSTGATNVYGVGAELGGTTWAAGAVPSVQSNICWRPTLGTGLIGQSNPSATVNNDAVTVADYNVIHNVSGGIYGNPSGQWTGTEGAHDVTADPQFVDSARNLFKFFTAYLGNSSGTTWATATNYSVGDIVSVAVSGYYQNSALSYRCITAHTSSSTNKPGSGSGWAQNWEPASVKPIEDSILAGATYSGGANSMIGELVAWVKAGFTPQNAALRGTAHDGGDIGAVAVLLADTTAPTVTPSIAPGTYSSTQSVTLSADETATIYYTTDGSTPTTSSTVYAGAISVAASLTLKTLARDTAGNERVQSFVYTINTTITGACGSNSGGSFDTLTSGTANNCATGSVTGFAGSGPWTWTCAGSNGGTDASCSASINQYTATPSAGSGGTLSAAQTINYGATATFTVTPAACYTVNSVTGCGGSLSGNTYTTVAMTGNCTVSATFAASGATYTVTPTAGANGTISPSTPQAVACGGTQAFTVTPEAGYRTRVSGTCGGSLSGTNFVTRSVTGNCSVTFNFPKKTKKVRSPFFSSSFGFH